MKKKDSIKLAIIKIKQLEQKRAIIGSYFFKCDILTKKTGLLKALFFIN